VDVYQHTSVYYEFSGEGAVSAPFERHVSPEVLVTPAGFARISAVKVRGMIAIAA
jgi:hypothetical protein